MDNIGAEFLKMIESNCGSKIAKSVVVAIVVAIFAAAISAIISIIHSVYSFINELKKNGAFDNGSKQDISIAIYTGFATFLIYVILLLLSHKIITKWTERGIRKLKEKAYSDMESIRNDVRLLRLEANQALIKAGYPEKVKPLEECWEQQELLPTKSNE